MSRTTRRRTGLTLTEVLVAMFVMALGMISLLTLFPLGAIQIGLALRDDRLTQTAVQADAFLRAYWRAKVVEPPTYNVGGLTPQPPDDLVWALDDPSLAGTPGGYPPLNTGAFPALRTPVSYPVLIDPLGFNTYVGPGQLWAGPDPATWQALPRRNIGSVNGAGGLDPANALRTCSLLDDLTFTAYGVPEPAGGPITRQGRYNWAALFQRRAGGTERYEVNLHILCFSERPPLLNVAGAEQTITATAQTSYTPSAGPQVLIDQPYVREVTRPPTPGGMPDFVRKGAWLLDVGTDATNLPVREAKFYRIIGVTENTNTPGTVDLDIDPPFEATVAAGQPVTFLMITGLTEVFQRPLLPAN